MSIESRQSIKDRADYIKKIVDDDKQACSSKVQVIKKFYKDFSNKRKSEKHLTANTSYCSCHASDVGMATDLSLQTWETCCNEIRKAHDGCKNRNRKEECDDCVQSTL